MTTHELLTPYEVDRMLRYPPGKSERLARRGKLPCLVLPDGAIRFSSEAIAKLMSSEPPAGREAPHAG